ncbi:MAG: helix-hairpin-helix domain-containing protein [Saprospiraceae bacterium]
MDLSQYFSSWDQADSYAVLAIALIGFLFGLLIGYLLRGPRVRRLRNDLKESEQQLLLARQELGGMKDQLDQKEADLQRVNYDLVEMTEKVDKLEEDKAKLYKDIFHANQEVEKQQATVRSYLTTIEDLNNQIAELEDAHEPEDAADLNIVQGETTPSDQATYTVGSTPPVDVSVSEDAYNRMERFEAKLAQLEAENQALKKQMENLHPGVATTTTKSPAVDSSALIFEIDDVDEEPDLQINSDKQVLSEKIIVTDIEKDDLTKIDGVGPFLQTKLHEMGIYTYAEIAGWDTNRIAEVTEKIGYFPGRIEKDDWVGQANQLYQLKQSNPAALATPTPQEDDLKIVEGIGPKIEQLLKDAGIYTWHDLADTDLERLQAILDQAGERYRIHDPGTWAEQARLAADGRWDDLNTLQEELKGGRKV